MSEDFDVSDFGLAVVNATADHESLSSIARFCNGSGFIITKISVAWTLDLCMVKCNRRMLKNETQT